MRKLICSALMILCLVLTACVGTEQQLESFSERLSQADSIRMTAQVLTDHGETVEEYTLEYSFDGTRWTVLVTQPAILSGITARIGEDATEVEYDGVILAAGDVLSAGVSPIASVPMLVRTLETGSLDCVWTESALTAGTYIYDDAVSASVWYDGEGNPVAAEMTENGIVKARCHFSDVEVEFDNHGTTDKTDLGGNQPEQPGT